MMQDFVRLHMMSILQPFAERLRDQQAQVQQLTSELRQDQEVAEARGLVLNRHEDEVASLRSEKCRQAEQLHTCQAELAAVKKEKNRLEGHHEMTKATLGATKDALAKLTTGVEALQQRTRECSEQQHGLESALGPMERKIMEHLETRLDKQGRVCKDLNDRQAELQKACQQARTFAENANLGIKKLNSVQELRKLDDDEGISGLRERTAQLEARLLDVDRELREHAEGMGSTDRELQHLRTWAEQLASVQKLHTQHAEMGGALHVQATRLNKVESDIAEIVGASAAERKLQKDDLDALDQRFAAGLADVEKLRDKHRAHGDLIGSTVRRVEELETGHRMLADRCAHADREVGSLDSWRQEAAQELRQQSLSLGAAQCNLSNVQNGVEVISTSVRELRSDILVDREALANFGSRLDLCCKYFNGLGKGLQDTQRQIVDGMLPPKLGGGTPALPALPKAPKASLPSPRAPTPRGAGGAPGFTTPRGSSTPRSSTPRLR
jgi:chromosome segregation ATPase